MATEIQEYGYSDSGDMGRQYKICGTMDIEFFDDHNDVDVS